MQGVREQAFLARLVSGRTRHAYDALIAFQRCIAVKIVGSLAVDPRLTRTAAPAVARQLLSDNPFVRHAAAETLYQLPSLAGMLQARLTVVAEEFSHESCGRIAQRTLDRVKAQK